MNISKVHFLGTFFGSLLILIGLIGPWFSYSAKWSYFDGNDRYHGNTYAKASPFTIKYTLNVTSSTPYDPGPIKKIIPVNIFLGEGTKFFYDPLASFLGLICVIGVIMSVISQYKNRWKISFLGGIISLSSTLSFFLTLPRNINVLNFTVMSQWYLTIIGAILIIGFSSYALIKSFLRTFFDLFLPYLGSRLRIKSTRSNMHLESAFKIENK